MNVTDSLTGVSFQRSEIGLEDVTDGTANTYFVGEKFIDIQNYDTGCDRGDNETWCTGYNNDNFRNGNLAPMPDQIAATYNPGNPCGSVATTLIADWQHRFGSAHSGIWNVSWCDGHVSAESFDIDLQVHRGNANRADEGRPLP